MNLKILDVRTNKSACVGFKSYNTKPRTTWCIREKFKKRLLRFREMKTLAFLMIFRENRCNV